MENNLIFFSYSREDGEEFALKLANNLKELDVNLWLDQFNIESGKTWDIEVEKAINNSSCVVFIATQCSTASKNVLDEVFYALDKGKKIIPLIAGFCEIPLRLHRMQFIDFTYGYDSAFAKLIKALGIVESEKRPNSLKVEEYKVCDIDGPDISIRSPHPLFALELKEILRQYTSVYGGLFSIEELITPIVEGNIRADFLVENDERILGIYDSSSAKCSCVFTNFNMYCKIRSANLVFPYETFPDCEIFLKDKYSVSFDSILFTVYYKTQRFIELLSKIKNKVISQSTEVKPVSYTYYFQKGLKYFKLGDFFTSLKFYNKAIKLNANDGRVFNNRGLVYYKLGDYTGACNDFQKALDMGLIEGQENFSLTSPKITTQHTQFQLHELMDIFSSFKKTEGFFVQPDLPKLAQSVAQSIFDIPNVEHILAFANWWDDIVGQFFAFTTSNLYYHYDLYTTKCKIIISYSDLINVEIKKSKFLFSPVLIINKLYIYPPDIDQFYLLLITIKEWARKKIKS